MVVDRVVVVVVVVVVVGVTGSGYSVAQHGLVCLFISISFASQPAPGNFLCCRHVTLGASGPTTP